MNSYSSSYRWALLCAAALPFLAASLHAGGGIDLSFNVGAGTNDVVNAVVVQADSKVIIAGKFTAYNHAVANSVARLNVDGSLDTAFNSGQGVTNSSGGGVTISTAALQSDGKIVLGGVFNVFNGRPVSNIVRLNPDGSVDTAFNVGTGQAAGIVKLAVDRADRIYAAGSFASFNGRGYSGLCRLNPDGSLDTTFSFPTTQIVLDGINTILPQADGTIIIGGDLASVPNHSVQRLNADGSPNNLPAFNANLANGASAVGVQSDGKILVGFDDVGAPYSGQTVGNLLRLNADGSLDNTFLSGNVPDGPGRGLETLLVQPDDKILIGGFFDPSFYPAIYPGIARLNADGSVDSGFNPGDGASYDVYSIALDPSGRVVIGGGFSEVDHASSPGVARLLTNVPATGAPTVTIVPGTAKVNEDGSSGPATFVATLSAAQSVKIKVKYLIKGTALAGYDYAALNGKVKFKPGETTETVTVSPINQGINTGRTVSVKVALEEGSGYALGAASTAKVKIVDNQ